MTRSLRRLILHFSGLFLLTSDLPEAAAEPRLNAGFPLMCGPVHGSFAPVRGVGGEAATILIGKIAAKVTGKTLRRRGRLWLHVPTLDRPPAEPFT